MSFHKGGASQTSQLRAQKAIHGPTESASGSQSKPAKRAAPKAEAAEGSKPKRARAKK